jgi:hypothetical protein
MLMLHAFVFWSLVVMAVLLPALLAGLLLARPVIVEVRHISGETPRRPAPDGDK